LITALIIGLSMPAVGAFAKSKTAKKAADVTLVGLVKAEKNKKGKVVAVSIEDGEGAVHKLRMTSAAKKVAKAFDGKAAQLTGTAISRKSKKGTVQWFTVKTFKAAASAPSAPDKDDDDGDNDEDDYEPSDDE
jgi:hypothetical protein